MNTTLGQTNRRILIVDDNSAIHEDFRKILSAGEPADEQLDNIKSLIFGPSSSASLSSVRFQIDSAYQGPEGLHFVQRGMAENRPYAMAFVDMRMPPGWDGIETIAHLWRSSPDLQIVLCTAYSDYSWDEMVAKLGQTDRLVILKKPFENVEVLQLANALTEKWRLLQQAKLRIGDLENMVTAQTEELRRSEEHLRQSQKMEAIGQLAGGIAHDFNNILGCIVGYTELAGQEASENAAALEHLQAVLKASRRAKDLVQQILTFSRQQEQERKPIQLQAVIQEALKLLRASLPATIDLRADINPDIPVVRADPSQVRQVLMNLVTNAVHAMRGRGQLGIRLLRIGLDAAAQPNLPAGNYAALLVSDTGCGMDRAILQRIFEPFFTTKEPGEGTGLGLAVVHGIMKSHGGAIKVDSQPGHGTTFHLYFPAHDQAEAGPSQKVRSIPQGHGERILFADDDPPLASSGKKILERAGDDVTTQTSQPLLGPGPSPGTAS